MSTDLFDYAESCRRRDEGIKTVKENTGDWMKDALIEVCRLSTGWEGPGEAVRAYVSDRVGNPHHPNAWGALIRTAISRGILIRTGEWVEARSVKSHGSMYPVLMRV